MTEMVDAEQTEYGKRENSGKGKVRERIMEEETGKNTQREGKREKEIKRTERDNDNNSVK